MLQKVNEAIRQTLLSIPVAAETHPYIVSLIEKAKDEGADFLYHEPTYIIVSGLKDNGNAMPDITHMPLIREVLTELDIPGNHIVYGSVVMGYPAAEPKPAEPRKDVIHIIR